MLCEANDDGFGRYDRRGTYCCARMVDFVGLRSSVVILTLFVRPESCNRNGGWQCPRFKIDIEFWQGQVDCCPCRFGLYKGCRKPETDIAQ